MTVRPSDSPEILIHAAVQPMLYQARIQYSQNLSEKLITYEIIINQRTKTVKAQQAAWSVLACGTTSFAADIVSDGQSSVLNYSPRTLHHPQLQKKIVSSQIGVMVGQVQL